MNDQSVGRESGVESRFGAKKIAMVIIRFNKLKIVVVNFSKLKVQWKVVVIACNNMKYRRISAETQTS